MGKTLKELQIELDELSEEVAKMAGREVAVYHRGDIVQIKGEPYLVAQVQGGLFATVSLKYGNRYRDGIEIEDSASITGRDIYDMTGLHLPKRFAIEGLSLVEK